ncbi:MAG TPA: ATP-binding protein [Dehalococcoidales bacterium]
MFKIPKTAWERVDVEATLELILKNAVAAVGGSAGVVAIWDEARGGLAPRASHGLDSIALASLDALLNEAAPDLAFSRGSFKLLSELFPDLDLPFSTAGQRQNPIISLPLKIGKKSIGLIYVLRPLDAIAFSEIEQPALVAFAEQAAVAIQNARLASLLSAEKQRLESVLENSAEGIMSIDSRCRILGLNAAMEKITGYPREEILGKRCDRMLHFAAAENSSPAVLQCPLYKRQLSEKPVFERDGVIITKDARTVAVSMVYSIVFSEKGEPINAVVNVRDISKAREMENFRETILSMLGHELQTPLSIIKGYTETLGRTDAKWDMETIQKGLRVIDEESGRLSQVMSKLLLASRLSGGELKLNKEPVHLPSLVKKVVKRLSGFTTLHRFKVDFKPDFPTLTVEPQLMEQVLTNLLENAIKYSPQGGRVTVSGRKVEGEVKITIADEGIGISKRDAEHLFERFHRVEKGQSRKIQGTGLGLYICKSIIEAHGGKIEVASQPGQGSSFSFILPLKAPE